jgi:hypothetical protein
LAYWTACRPARSPPSRPPPPSSRCSARSRSSAPTHAATGWRSCARRSGCSPPTAWPTSPWTPSPPRPGWARDAVRRFGDRAGLARALLDASERRLQDGFLHGPPPLGPGAPPRARLKAFAGARFDQLERHADLIAAAEAGGARFVAEPYCVHRLHVGVLVHEADPGADAEILADVLLAPLSAESFDHWRGLREMPRARMEAGYRTLVDRVLPEEDEA